MRNWMKFPALCLVAIAVSVAQAGSYDDFFVAIKRDEPREIRSLLERGFDPNTPDPQGQDGLYIALRDGSLKAAAALIDWPETNVDKRTLDDESPLMMACLRGHAEIARR